MLTAQERAPLIEQIRRLPDQIDYLAGVLSPDELSGHFVAGEWSAAQNIHHLVDSHMNSYVRCRLMITEEEPPLKPYDQDRWAALPDAAAGDVTPSLLILRGLHARWAQFYAALAEEDWARTGSHPERGLVTLESQLQMYAKHGLAHIEQIRRTVAAQYTQPPISLDELLARIDREWARLGSLLARMTPEQLVTPLASGWSPKDHLAHITAWERFLTGYVIGGQPAHEAFGMTVEQFEPWDVDRYNAIFQERSARTSLAEVQATFDRVHEQARAAVAGIDWAQWHGQMHQEGDGPAEPRLTWITSNSYDHYLEHWQWLPVV
jgi:hypothetical protein